MKAAAHINKRNTGKTGRPAAGIYNKEPKALNPDLIRNSLTKQENYVQRKEAEEEELQMKPLVQKQEEEEVQTKFAQSTPGQWVQRQPMEEEEEMMQPKSWMQLQKAQSTSGPATNIPDNWMQKQAIEEEEMQMKKGLQTPGIKNSSGGSKTSLPADVRNKMQHAFGTDFTNVNIHKDSPKAAQMHALAYTSGNEIHFAPGQYRPSTGRGQELIGHELTHVVQQRGGRVNSGKQFSFGKVNDDPALEREADIMGKKASSGEKVMYPQGLAMGTAEPGSIQAKTTAEKLKDFRSKDYSKTNFIPSTGKGFFNVHLNPVNGRLEIKLNVGFNFKDGPAAAFAKIKGASEKWSDAEKESWKKRYIALIEGRWGGKYHFSNPDLPGVTVYVDVEIEEVSSDWHYQLNVTKAPPGKMPQSSVTHFVNSGKAIAKENLHYATLDSNDLEWKDLTNKPGVTEKQKGAVHEFGHMVGLGDEYKAGISHAALVQSALGKKITKGDTDDIMSCGDSINKQHYVTFLDALNNVTGMNNWKFKNP